MNEPTEPEVGAVTYLGGVVLLSVAAWLWWLLRRNRTSSRGAPPWSAGWLDAAILMWAVVTVMLVVPVAVAKGFQEQGGLSPELSGALGALFMQAGLLVYLLGHRPVPLARPGAFQAAGFGISVFLLALPVVLVIQLGWQSLLVWINSRTQWNLPIEQQEAFDYLTNFEHPEAVALFAVAALIGAPLWEELCFRGRIFPFLAQRFGVGAGIVVSGILFGVIHPGLLALPGLILLGCALAWAYHRTGHLAAPIAAHAAFNLNSVILAWLGTRGDVSIL